MGQARVRKALGLAGTFVRSSTDWPMRAFKTSRRSTCEVCKGPTRTVKSRQQPTTLVRFCSKPCRRRRHNRRAA